MVSGDHGVMDLPSANKRTTLEKENMHFITPLFEVDSTIAIHNMGTANWGMMNILPHSYYYYCVCIDRDSVYGIGKPLQETKTNR